MLEMMVLAEVVVVVAVGAMRCGVSDGYDGGFVSGGGGNDGGGDGGLSLIHI